MGSWSYVSGGKGFVSDESVSMTDRLARSRNGLMSWELSAPCSYGGTVVCPPQEGIGNQGFVELGSQDLIRKAMGNSSLTEALTSNSGGGRGEGGGGGERAFTAIRNVFSREEDSSSKLSISVVESNSRDSSLIDLKLGGFPDHPDVRNIKSPKLNNTLSSAQSSTPAKRLRAGGMNSHTPYCQVQGCKKDLSSCKDYHKRHKVCEVHSKTAKVIVNGIEQRFCQQCSRFHLLAEFDDGKRSCRKRLAGHNERRRKPHAGVHSGRTGRLFQSYAAARFEGTSSFVCQDILPGNLVHPQKYEWYRNVKVEEGTDFSPQVAIPLTNGHGHAQAQPKCVFASFNSEKQCPDGGISELTRGRIGESSNSYVHDMAGADFVPHSVVYHNTSLGSEVVNAFDSSSSIQGLSGISNSGRALSLLSSQSQSCSTASIIPSAAAHSLINPGTYEMASTSALSSPSGINSCEDARLQQMMLFCNSGQSYAIVQGSEYMKVKSQICGEDGPTIDLLQLSSQLQRVEHERQSVQVKQETGAFSGLRIT